MAYLAGSVLGPRAELPAGDRAELLDTLQAWRDCRGSAAQADVTELCLALEAARQQAGWPAASGRIPAL